MRNHDYIKFVLSKVENGFIEFNGSPEYARVMTILNALKSSNDILKEIYILSGINKLRELSFYLVFMFRKLESGRINLDNLLENYFADRGFIENYLKTYFNLEPVAPADEHEEEKEINLFEETGPEPTEDRVYSLAEPNFKVEELDNELVTEEFNETKLLELYDISESKYMELIQNNNANLQALPESIDKIIESDDVFNLPDVSEKENTDEINGQQEITTPENIDGYNETEKEIQQQDEKSAEVKKEEPHDMASFFETIDRNKVHEDLEDVVVPAQEDKIPLFEQTGKETPESEAGKIVDEEITPAKKELTGQEIKKEVFSEGKDNVQDIPAPENKENEPEIPGVDRELEQKLQEIEQETNNEIINSDFQKYEEELFENNRTINGLLDDLLLILNSKEQDYEMKNAITDEIVSISSGMEECSKKMAFEIITKVYSSFVFCLDKKFREISVTVENIEVFKNSLSGVEKLVNGDELSGFDKTIKQLEELENDLDDLLSKREEFEKKKFDFGEEERKIIEEFTDSGEKEAYLALRDRIMDMEEIFNSLVSIKEKIAPFEVLRRLSHSFSQFREIVNIARILEMHKMAQLAEASYIFVKFLQNYRMDPYQKEVSEVLKYIIYCCKLIYLDKPVKDLDTFVSYLNDPVRIFHTNTKNENE